MGEVDCRLKKEGRAEGAEGFGGRVIVAEVGLPGRGMLGKESGEEKKGSGVGRWERGERSASLGIILRKVAI